MSVLTKEDKELLANVSDEETRALEYERFRLADRARHLREQLDAVEAAQEEVDEKLHAWCEATRTEMAAEPGPPCPYCNDDPNVECSACTGEHGCAPTRAACQPEGDHPHQTPCSCACHGAELVVVAYKMGLAAVLA